MPTRLAVKRLTASDLTFFEFQFRTRDVGNQKAINLNADVFIDQLYPVLPDYAVETAGRIPIDLSVYGPNGAPLHDLQRKIVKFGTYKNWRLDGEFVYNPDDSPERYNSLEPGDLAVMAFAGDVVKPDAATLVLLGRAAQSDSALLKAFDDFLGAESMRSLTQRQLQALIDATEPDEAHPILALTTDTATDEEIGREASRRLGVRRAGRKQTREDLERGKRLREALGRRGEEFVNAYLRGAAGIRDVRWLEDDDGDAAAPYDFQYSTDAGEVVRIDVKTSSVFDKLFFLSEPELEEIRDEARYRHDLFRVYGIDEGARNAKLRIAENVRELAAEILNAELPDGVAILSVAVKPSSLGFGAELGLSLPITDSA